MMMGAPTTTGGIDELNDIFGGTDQNQPQQPSPVQPV
jgi:hypothetical protein